jgi:hypothetical protein
LDLSPELGHLLLSELYLIQELLRLHQFQPQVALVQSGSLPPHIHFSFGKFLFENMTSHRILKFSIFCLDVTNNLIDQILKIMVILCVGILALLDILDGVLKVFTFAAEKGDGIG